MKRRGVNIFSHNGGVATGLRDEIHFLLYTCYNEIIKGELERKMDLGELPRAPIIRFAYTITSSPFLEEGEGADIVIGLVHHKQWQENELSIPDPSGRFPGLQCAPEIVHRASLYESLGVATACRATEILLFFPYHPFAPALNTMSVFKTHRVSMRCFEFSLQGKYTPFRHLYALEIKRLGRSVPSSDMVEFIRVKSLAIKVTQGELPKTKNPDELFAQRSALVWDIAPGIIHQARAKMKEIPAGEEDQYLLQIYSSSEKPEGESWNYDVSDNLLVQFASQGTALGSLGWT